MNPTLDESNERQSERDIPDILAPKWSLFYRHSHESIGDLLAAEFHVDIVGSCFLQQVEDVEEAVLLDDLSVDESGISIVKLETLARRIKMKNSLSVDRFDRASDISSASFTCVDSQAVLLAENNFLSGVVDEFALVGVSRDGGLDDEWRAFDFLSGEFDCDAEREKKKSCLMSWEDLRSF